MWWQLGLLPSGVRAGILRMAHSCECWLLAVSSSGTSTRAFWLSSTWPRHAVWSSHNMAIGFQERGFQEQAFQQEERRSLLRPGLEVPKCHFHHILWVKAVTSPGWIQVEGMYVLCSDMKSNKHMQRQEECWVLPREMSHHTAQQVPCSPANTHFLGSLSFLAGFTVESGSVQSTWSLASFFWHSASISPREEICLLTWSTYSHLNTRFKNKSFLKTDLWIDHR